MTYTSSIILLNILLGCCFGLAFDLATAADTFRSSDTILEFPEPQEIPVQPCVKSFTDNIPLLHRTSPLTKITINRTLPLTNMTTIQTSSPTNMAVTLKHIFIKFGVCYFTLTLYLAAAIATAVVLVQRNPQSHILENSKKEDDKDIQSHNLPDTDQSSGGGAQAMGAVSTTKSGSDQLNDIGGGQQEAKSDAGPLIGRGTDLMSIQSEAKSDTDQFIDVGCDTEATKNNFKADPPEQSMIVESNTNFERTAKDPDPQSFESWQHRCVISTMNMIHLVWEMTNKQHDLHENMFFFKLDLNENEGDSNRLFSLSSPFHEQASKLIKENIKSKRNSSEYGTSRLIDRLKTFAEDSLEPVLSAPDKTRAKLELAKIQNQAGTFYSQWIKDSHGLDAELTGSEMFFLCIGKLGKHKYNIESFKPEIYEELLQKMAEQLKIEFFASYM